MRNLIFTNLFFTFLCTNVFLQGQPVEYKGNAIVLEATETTVKVDFLEKEENYLIEFSITSQTQFSAKKGAAGKDQLRPGVEIKLEGRSVNYVNQLEEVKILSGFAGEEVELEGLLEHYDPKTQIAVVDGEKVKLGKKAVIKGGKGIKGKFRSFQELTLGNFVEIEGVRNENGLVIAEKGKVEKNDFDKYDQELRGAFNDNYSDKQLKEILIPANLKSKYKLDYDALDGGSVTVGGARHTLVDDIELQAYVNHVGNKVVPKWQKNIPYQANERIRFRFYVIDNPTFNAFAMPNGMIFVHTGLIKQLDNEAQLAAVLGHEVAHATYEHAKERYERKQKIENWKRRGTKVFKLMYNTVPWVRNFISDNIITPENVFTVATALNQFNQLPPQSRDAIMSFLSGAGGITSSVHSRKREEQSDRVGLYYMEQAGYDPREASQVWAKFMNLTADKGLMSQVSAAATDFLNKDEAFAYSSPMESVGDYLGSFLVNKMMDNWFSSHPKAEKRYRNLNQLVATNYSSNDFSFMTIGKEEFQEIKNRLK